MCPATDGKPTSKRRKEGLPEYEIREFDTDGTLVPRRQPLHFPVLYVEPETLEGTLAGLDLASGEVVREAIEQAKASGEMVVTGQFIVARETEEERGVIVSGPVYRPGEPVATPQEHRAKPDRSRGQHDPRGTARATRIELFRPRRH